MEKSVRMWNQIMMTDNLHQYRETKQQHYDIAFINLKKIETFSEYEVFTGLKHYYFSLYLKLFQ